jgi:MinD superfamily P-loop ATPase
MKSICLYILIVEWDIVMVKLLEVRFVPVTIDSEKCGKIDNCPGEGLCIKLCEQGALIEKDGDVVLISENCDDCDLCIQNCPNQAISKV